MKKKETMDPVGCDLYYFNHYSQGLTAGDFHTGGQPGKRRDPKSTIHGQSSTLSKATPVQSNEVTKYNQGDYTNILFVHHSVGRFLIEGGELRSRLQNEGYTFWDQDYSYEGLTKPDGTPAGYSYFIPNDNTDIDGFADIFQQREYSIPINALSSFLQHEVILIKSCYPNSAIQDDAELELRKQQYMTMRSRMDQYPNHIFIILTSPPLNPAETNPEDARRARELTSWLAAPEFTKGHPNLFVFNFFDLLAESDPSASDYNMLRSALLLRSDSPPQHPCQPGGGVVPCALVNFIKDSINSYRILFT